MTTIALEYNRSEKEWQLKGEIGEILQRFPAGPEGYRDAVLTQLMQLDRDAFNFATNMEADHPEFAGRAYRGAQLYVTGSVSRAEGRFYVKSQREKTASYTVFHLVGRQYPWQCSCWDWRMGADNKPQAAPRLKIEGTWTPICKHILAVLMHERAQAKAKHPRSEPRPAPAAEIELVIEYETDEARRHGRLKDLGTLVEIAEDGKTRPPANANVSQAIAWLDRNDYQQTARAWVGPGARPFTKRQRQTWRLVTEASTEAEIDPPTAGDWS